MLVKELFKELIKNKILNYVFCPLYLFNYCFIPTVLSIKVGLTSAFTFLIGPILALPLTAFTFYLIEQYKKNNDYKPVKIIYIGHVIVMLLIILVV